MKNVARLSSMEFINMCKTQAASDSCEHEQRTG